MHRLRRPTTRGLSRVVAAGVVAMSFPACSSEAVPACVPGEPMAGIDLASEELVRAYNDRDVPRLVGLIGEGAVRDPSLAPGAEGIYPTVDEWLSAADAVGDHVTLEGYSFEEPFLLFVVRRNTALEQVGIDHLSVNLELWANQDCEWRVDSVPEVISAPDPCAYSDLFQTDASPEGCRGSLGPRVGHIAVWTGSQLLVYGGAAGSHQAPPLDTGLAYDPVEASWHDLAPSPVRLEWWQSLQGVWAGDQMLVAGRATDGSGIVVLSYEPGSDTWSTSPTLPSDREAVGGVVWTGTELILAGGDEHYPDRTAWAYSPETSQWRQLPDLPGSDVAGIEGIWIGTEALFFGGFGGSTTPTLAYDPNTNSWRRLAIPQGPWIEGHRMIWTGTRVIVYSGHSGPGLPARLLIYDPASNAWLESSPLPIVPRERMAGAWTGARLVLWGGFDSAGAPDVDGDSIYGDGAAYDPDSDTWTILADAPLGDRCDHTATWTGTALVIVGGMPSCGDPNVLAYGDAASYDPSTDEWELLVRR